MDIAAANIAAADIAAENIVAADIVVVNIELDTVEQTGHIEQQDIRDMFVVLVGSISIGDIYTVQASLS